MLPLFIKKKIESEIYYEELVGLQSQMRSLRGFCDFVWSSDWEQHSRALRFMPTILLYGPPGTGKTTLLKNLASSLNDESLEYYRESLDLLANKELGETSKAVESLFSKIKERANSDKKVLLQLDDVDSLLSSRHSVNESSGIRRAVNTFLIQLDELALENFKFPPIISATTNMLDHLDMAIKRRFSLKVEVNPQLDEFELEKLIFPISKLWAPNSAPDYREIRTIAKEKSLTPNDIIRAMQTLYLQSRNGQIPSDNDILNAVHRADSSVKD